MKKANNNTNVLSGIHKLRACEDKSLITFETECYKNKKSEWFLYRSESVNISSVGAKLRLKYFGLLSLNLMLI